MSILNNCSRLVDTYLPMMNNITLAKLGKHGSATIPLTGITIFQVLGSVLFYNPQVELSEQDNRGVMQHVF